MFTEEIIKIIMGKLVNVAFGIVAGYCVLVIRNIYKDINKIGEISRECKNDIEKIENNIISLQINVGKLEQQMKDNATLCDSRHKKKS